MQDLNDIILRTPLENSCKNVISSKESEIGTCVFLSWFHKVVE